jgi:hypothetical protein
VTVVERTLTFTMIDPVVGVREGPLRFTYIFLEVRVGETDIRRLPRT